MAERVVLAHKGDTSMVKFRWTEQAPQDLYDVEYAEELGAVWEGPELVIYDLEGFTQLFEYYKGNTYMPDND